MKKCLILLVEDDQNDAYFVSRALKELGFDGRLEHITDAHAALEYLSGTGVYCDREKHPLPDIVISDSTLPGRHSGVELLEWVRKSADLGQTPFVMLSGEIPPDVQRRANAAGANLLLQKGSNFRDTGKALKQALLQMPLECRRWLKS